MEWYLALAGFLAVAGFVKLFSNESGVRKRLRMASVNKIAKITEGKKWRVIGKAGALVPTIRAPMTLRNCVYYHARVERHMSGGEWRVVAFEQQGVRFSIDDGSEVAWVDPTNAFVYLNFDGSTRSGVLEDPDLVEAEFLVRHNLPSSSIFLSRKYRYREAVIEVGERITIVGHIVLENDPTLQRGSASGYRGVMQQRKVFRGSEQDQLVLSDEKDMVVLPDDPQPVPQAPHDDRR